MNNIKSKVIKDKDKEDKENKKKNNKEELFEINKEKIISKLSIIIFIINNIN